MNVSAYSIRNPIPAILLFALLTLAGLLAFKNTIVQDFPDIQLPIVTVTVAQPGTAPAQLETEVARKVENSVATVSGIKNMYTTVLDGMATTTVEFQLEKNITDAVTEVRDAVSQIRSDLPADVREPIISKLPTAGRVVEVHAVQLKPGTGWDQQQLSWYVDNTVNKRLLNIKGVGAVKRVGGVTREVQVILQPERMQALGVTAADVSRQIGLVQQDAPSGRGEVGGGEQSVRTVASARSADELAQLQIPLASGGTARLGDVAEVKDTVAEQRAEALVNGKPVVAIEIFRSKGASEVGVSTEIGKAMQELQQQNPDVVITRVIDNATPVQENFEGSMHLLYEGAILAVLVVWLFLRDWRATIVAATALPLSIIPTYLGLAYFGYTLNGVTLLALALVVGVLVDDAIVEIENISRHLAMGKTPFQAALEAADEIGMAVIATTFALVSVFLPTAFMSGISGMFFKQFGWTAVLAILASLAVARLLTPMMAAYLLKPHKGVRVVEEHGDVPPDQSHDGPVMRFYMRLMQWCLRHRLATILAAIGFFVGSLMLVPLLPTGFVPPADRGQTQITIELPPGSTLDDTRHAAEMARTKLAQNPNVVSIYSSVGGGSSGDGFKPGAAAEVHRAVLTLNLVHRDDRTASLADIDTQIRSVLETIPGARFQVGSGDMGSKMELVLLGDDPVVLTQAAREAERQLRTLEGVGGVSSSAALVQPELIIRPDFARAADLGVSTAAIAQTVRVATAGDYDQQLPKMNLADRQVPIRVKLPDDARTSVADIEQLLVPSRAGMIPLINVATVSLESGPSVISRINRSRSVRLEVELGSRTLGEVNEEARALPAFSQLPPGVRIAELGDAQEMQDLFNSFGIAMMIGVLCIYGVLVLLFHDFMQPGTILGALPMAIGGAFVALLITDKALSMPSMIGLIMLMGIVTKNSILLVDYAILAREDGKSRTNALIDACHKRSRPIVMTTIAMGAGMMPLAMGLSKGDPSFNSPMAITVIGGLLTSTLLSLLVVPALFTYVDDLKLWLTRRFGLREQQRKQTTAQEATAAGDWSAVGGEPAIADSAESAAPAAASGMASGSEIPGAGATAQPRASSPDAASGSS